MATRFHVVRLIQDAHMNPDGKTVRKYFDDAWASWAGLPDESVMVDRARYFLGHFC